MKHLILTTALCFSLTACETASNISWPSLNPFGSDEVTKVIIDASEIPTARVAQVDQSTLQTELDEMELLTGDRMRVKAATSQVEPIEMVKVDIEPVTEKTIIKDVEIAEAPSVEAMKARVIEAEAKMAKIKVDTQEPIMVTTPKPEMVIEEKAPDVVLVESKSASGCPLIQIMPSAKSMTNFENNMSGQMTSRASITDVKGGCEIVNGGMEIDLDILMRGTITNKGRFEGKVNEEAFVTFPYFISIMTPNRTPVHKKIMATAMRFRPSVNYLDHAEKITQFVPMADIQNSGDYKIVVGYQLQRKQLEYNRLENAARPNDERVSPDTSVAKRKSYNPLAGE